ncbi:uncharacterized protein LOC132926143 [Rhopalosiphum padi]|uniref:uncharacterized protein LOC132926143 n=1 Tax=Rhopalosiphum padi TaxID=40932 RepID=UPI00298E1601|nr:uncharacterized protein LOC132926143 [Rhopalosiphum padi]
MATSERFVQSFVVEFRAPRSFAVVASIVQHAFVARPPVPAAADDHGVAQTGHTAGGRQQPSTDFQLFVGRLTSATTAEHLRKTFSEYGEVVHVRVIGGHNRSGRPTKFSYAFVTFSGPEGVAAALAGAPIELCNGNRVNVHPSKGRK